MGLILFTTFEAYRKLIFFINKEIKLKKGHMLVVNPVASGIDKSEIIETASLLRILERSIVAIYYRG
jgi:hypothetical protein